MLDRPGLFALGTWPSQVEGSGFLIRTGSYSCPREFESLRPRTIRNTPVADPKLRREVVSMPTNAGIII